MTKISEKVLDFARTQKAVKPKNTEKQLKNAQKCPKNEKAPYNSAFGARGRTRTGTNFRSQDFKSCASAIPPLGQKLI